MVNFDDTAKFNGNSKALSPELFDTPKWEATIYCVNCRKRKVKSLGSVCETCASHKRHESRRVTNAKHYLIKTKSAKMAVGAEALTCAPLPGPLPRDGEAPKPAKFPTGKTNSGTVRETRWYGEQTQTQTET